MRQTFPVIVYVALYCLHKLNLRDVLAWHQLSGRVSDLQLTSLFILR